VLLEQPCRV